MPASGPHAAVTRSAALACAAALAASLTTIACGGYDRSLRTSALEFLYPKGAEARPPSDVRLTLPVRVGIAFAPLSYSYKDPFTEDQKQRLLEQMAVAFRAHKNVGAIETIPTHYLNPAGSFENLDRLATAFGLDLMALVSYDQRQFSESTGLSWTYLTIVGAFAVQGEKNETRTFLDAVVYDIRSRALLFRAGGESRIGDRSTPVTREGELRSASEEGFSKATDDLIVNLQTSLKAFEEQAGSGTVRGPGTPAVTLTDASGAVAGSGGGSGGGIAFGPLEAVAAVALAALGLAGEARRRRRRG